MSRFAVALTLVFVVGALTSDSVGAAPLPVSGASTRLAVSRPKPADPFAEGSEVEAKSFDIWYTATVVTRTPDGAQVKLTHTGQTEAVTQANLRARGVTTAEVKPDFMVRYFGMNARVEYQQGPWWYEGVIVKRDGPRANVRDVHGFAKWHDLAELRSREVAPGGLGTIAPPAAATQPGETVAAGATPGAKVPDGSHAKRLALDSFTGAWGARPDPSTRSVKPVVAANPGPIALPALLPKSKEFFEQFRVHQTRVLVDAGATTGCVVQEAHPPQGGSVSQLVKVNFAAGTASAVINLPRGLAVTAVSPDARRVVLQRREFTTLPGGSLAQVDSIESQAGLAASSSQVAEFQPFAGEGENKAPTLSAAAFVDADHVLFAGGENLVELVDVPRMAVVWSGKAGLVHHFAVSPGGRQVALPTDRGVYLVDSMSGEPLGHFEGEPQRWAFMRFSDDGSRLAAYDEEALCVWDVGSGKVIAMAEVGGGRGGRIDWLSNDYLLLDGYKLVDVAKSTVVWTYEYAEKPAAQGNQQPAANAAQQPRIIPGGASVGGRLWFAETKRLGGGNVRTARDAESLVAVTIPEPHVAQLMAGMNPDNLYALAPGMKVSLSISAQTADAKKLAEGITDRLKQAGLVVAENAPVRLEAGTSAGESKTLRYRKMGEFGPRGPGSGQESATVTSTRLRVAFVLAADGKVLWERTGSVGGFAPGVVQLKQGQSVQDAVNQQSVGGNDSFFTTQRYPKYLSKVGEGNGFGTSLLTEKGAVPAPDAPAKP